MLSGNATPNVIVTLADTLFTVAVTRTLVGRDGAFKSITARLLASGVTLAVLPSPPFTNVPSVAVNSTVRLPVGMAAAIVAVTWTSVAPSAGAEPADAASVTMLPAAGGVKPTVTFLVTPAAGAEANAVSTLGELWRSTNATPLLSVGTSTDLPVLVGCCAEKSVPVDGLNVTVRCDG